MSAAGPAGPSILGLGWHPNEQKHRGHAVHCLPNIFSDLSALYVEMLNLTNFTIEKL